MYRIPALYTFLNKKKTDVTVPCKNYNTTLRITQILISVVAHELQAEAAQLMAPVKVLILFLMYFLKSIRILVVARKSGFIFSSLTICMETSTKVICCTRRDWDAKIIFSFFVVASL